VTASESFGGSSAAGASDVPPALDEGPAPARPLADIVKDLTGDLGTLFRQEVELAKAELKQEARKGGKAAGVLGAAAGLGLVGAIILAMAIGFGLSILFGAEDDFFWGFLITAVVLLVAAAIAASNGRKKLQQVDPKPDQTIETLREDARYLKEQAR
jgi:Putative Actinobacterial Holin-X, holin superfamily III